MLVVTFICIYIAYINRKKLLLASVCNLGTRWKVNIYLLCKHLHFYNSGNIMWRPYFTHLIFYYIIIIYYRSHWIAVPSLKIKSGSLFYTSFHHY